MKVKVTKKSIINNYRHVYWMEETKAQTIFYGQSPAYYTSGVYGWNCDVYIIDSDTVVTAGYRPFGERLPEAVEKDMLKKATRIKESNKYRYSEIARKIAAIRENGFSIV